MCAAAHLRIPSFESPVGPHKKRCGVTAEKPLSHLGPLTFFLVSVLFRLASFAHPLPLLLSSSLLFCSSVSSFSGLFRRGGGGRGGWGSPGVHLRASAQGRVVADGSCPSCTDARMMTRLRDRHPINHPHRKPVRVTGSFAGISGATDVSISASDASPRRSSHLAHTLKESSSPRCRATPYPAVAPPLLSRPFLS